MIEQKDFDIKCYPKDDTAIIVANGEKNIDFLLTRSFLDINGNQVNINSSLVNEFLDDLRSAGKSFSFKAG